MRGFSPSAIAEFKPSNSSSKLSIFGSERKEGHRHSETASTCHGDALKTAQATLLQRLQVVGGEDWMIGGAAGWGAEWITDTSHQDHSTSPIHSSSVIISTSAQTIGKSFSAPFSSFPPSSSLLCCPGTRLRIFLSPPFLPSHPFQFRGIRFFCQIQIQILSGNIDSAPHGASMISSFRSFLIEWSVCGWSLIHRAPPFFADSTPAMASERSAHFLGRVRSALTIPRHVRGSIVVAAVVAGVYYGPLW